MRPQQTPLQSVGMQTHRTKGGWGGKGRAQAVHICSGAPSLTTRKGLTPEASTVIDSMNLRISKSCGFDVHCQLVFVDVLQQYK